MQSDSFLYKFYYQWWKNIDKSIFFIISLLFIIGLFFSLVSTSLIASDKLDTNSYFFFFKHLIYVLIGIFIVFIFSSFKKEQLIKYSIILFFISLLSLVLVPIIGITVLEFFLFFKNSTSISLTSQKTLIISFLSSFISGLIACKYMIYIVKYNNLKYFGVYCVLIAFVVIFITQL